METYGGSYSTAASSELIDQLLAHRMVFWRRTGVRLTELQTVIVGLILNGAAFFGEICRAGLESVPAGQRKAGAQRD
jgi:ABC-type amino acid transport system permease subunit